MIILAFLWVLCYCGAMYCILCPDLKRPVWIDIAFLFGTLGFGAAIAFGAP